nr:hypothetical protein [Sphingomonas sp. PP-CE-1A-559]
MIFASIPDGLGWKVVHHDWWKAESPAKLRFGRDKERGGSPFLIAGGGDTLRGLDDVDATVEVGGFVEERAAPSSTYSVLSAEDNTQYTSTGTPAKTIKSKRCGSISRLGQFLSSFRLSSAFALA